MGGGPIPLKAVWAMLEDCAPGHIRRLRTHNYSILFNGRVYQGFPKGEHGTSNPEIQRSHIRRLVKFFSIADCAARHLGF
jgi:hypothetical protein